VGTAVAILTAAGLLSVLAGPFAEGFAQQWRGLVSTMGAVGAVETSMGALALGSLGQATSFAMDVLFLPLSLLLVAGAATSFLQVGPVLAHKAVAPDLSRIDPVKGLTRLFSQRQFVQLVKACVSLVVIGWVVVATLKEGLRGVVSLSLREADVAIQSSIDLVTTLLLRVGAAVLAMAVLDLAYQKWRHLEDLKMSKDEVRREHREAEGDPHAKQQRARLHREIAEHGILEEVRRADVLVVNPTHVAVALRYDQEDEESAPQVTAQGQLDLARRMRLEAERENVPIIRDVPLAHALWELSVGEEIPQSLYEAVAIVLKSAWEQRDQRAVEDGEPSASP
jgi:flagellar biosynthesis protein FlhB